ncbi:autotransporter-associated beta strand repeat-containing protein [Phyllobacterium sp. OV277]|uniref:autotransporter-associated beta strand repeat-containing protein n=1 Tax=Phyllobacterium sp. OV277 TaxID=1882772 RepID=UPI0015875045|nr:autotransporter-associated beta strand repeat-containing protein [Phyllobacterium sp. OV277]
MSGLLSAGLGVLPPEGARADNRYWDGSNTTGNGVINGGPGTWDSTTTNWTGSLGQVNTAWSSTNRDTAVFQGTPGTGIVTVGGVQSIGGVTFNVNGYQIKSATTADGLKLTNELFDSSNNFKAGQGITGEINAQISGDASSRFVKQDKGTIILSGNNTYQGGTTVEEGTLLLKDGGTLGATTGSTVISGGTLDLGGTTQQQDGGLSVDGGTIKNGTIGVGSATINDGGTVAADVQLNASTSVTQSGGTMAGTVGTPGAKTPLYTQTGGELSGTANVNAYNLSGDGKLTGTVNTDTATIKNNGNVDAGAHLNAGTSITQSGGTMAGTVGTLLAKTPLYTQTGGELSGTANVNAYDLSASGRLTGTVNADTVTMTTGGGNVVAGSTLNATTSITQSTGTMAGNATTSTYTFSGGTLTGTVHAITLDQKQGTIQSDNINATNYNISAGALTGTVTGQNAVISDSGIIRSSGTINAATSITQSIGTIMNGTATTATYTFSGGSLTGTVTATTLDQKQGTIDSDNIKATHYNISAGALAGTVTGETAVLSGSAIIRSNGTIKTVGGSVQQKDAADMHGTVETSLYEQSGTGTMDGRVKTDTYLLSGGTLDRADRVTTKAFGQTGGTINFGNVIADINVRAMGGTISALSQNGINVWNTTGQGINISTSGDSPIGTATGTAITARETTGNITIRTSATVVGTAGIDATTAGGGNVNIVADAAVGGTTGAGISAGSVDGFVSVTSHDIVQGGSYGILASSQNGQIDVQADKVVSGANGISANNTGTGNVTVTANSGVLGTSGAGVAAGSVSGNVSVTARDNVQGGSYGILASSQNGQIDVKAGKIVSGANGISANNTGAGNVTVTASGGVLGTSGAGISAGSAGGHVSVIALDNVQGGSYGVLASSQTGQIDVQTNGAVAAAAGISANATGAGNVNITANGAVAGTSGAAISAGSVGGNVTIAGSGALNGGSYGVFAKSQAGNISVKTGNVISGNNAVALETTGNGAMELDLGGALTATDTAISFKGETTNSHALLDQDITAGQTALRSNSTGVVTFDNYSTIKSASGNAASLTLLDNVAGQAVLNNYSGGQMQGMLSSGAGAQTLVNNMSGGIWDMGNSGVSNLLGSNDVIQNSGLIKATGNTQLNGLERFENNAGGQISLVNGAVGDKLTISGDYIGHAGSNIALDVNFDNSTADAVTVGGVLMGTTNLKLNALTAGQAPTAFGKTILVLDAAKGGDGTVTVEGLPSGGIVQYDVARIGGSGSDPSRFVIRSGINGTAASSVVSGFIAAQNVIGSSFFKPSSGLISAPVDPDKNQFGLAPWIRTNGGMSKIDTKGTIYQPDGTSVEAPATIETSYYGYQVGLDSGFFNIQDTGSNVNFGITGGQIFGKSDQKNFANTTDFSSVFYGAYAAYTKGPFFIDLQVRQELMDYTVNVDDPIFKIKGGDVEGKRMSIGGSTSYTLPYKDWSFIPATGFTYSKSSTDDLLVPRNILLNQNEARVRFSDVESLIGFGGITVSRNFFFKDDRIRLSPFVTATAYHDFAGDIDATLTMDPSSSNPVVLPVKTDRLKTYGEVSFGANLLALTGKINGVDRLVIGSVRGDFQYGENIIGGSVTAQFRMQF